jgi:hypothetical protein
MIGFGMPLSWNIRRLMPSGKTICNKGSVGHFAPQKTQSKVFIAESEAHQQSRISPLRAAFSRHFSLKNNFFAIYSRISLPFSSFFAIFTP